MPWTDPLRTAAASLLFVFTLAASAQQPAPPLPPIPPISGPTAPSAQPAFVVVLDAAHGGADAGAKISPTLAEKDLNLSLAVRLRALLTAQGIAVISTRTNDTDLPMATRAGVANHAQAAACLVLHATSSGNGVHLFTSSLAPVAQSRPSFLPWNSAQAGFVSQSVRLSSDIDAALSHDSIPVVLGRTFLQPLDSLTCPAVAIEIAPIQAGSISSGKALDDPKYQSSVLDSIAAAIQQWREDWRQQP